MIRTLTLSLFIFFGTIGTVFSQVYGNEWIDLNKTYFKLKVIEDGFYKVSYNELTNVGFPVDAVNPQNIQLWHRGKEVSIEVIGEDDNTFNASDYFLFYGQKADAALETPLYEKPEYQLNPTYSLYSDTSYYYLTWDETQKGNRITNAAEVDDSEPLLTEFKYLDRFVYALDYSRGIEPVEYVYKSEFDQGEGWMTQVFGYRPSKPTANTLQQVKAITGDKVISFETEVIGRNKNQHNVSLKLGTTVTQSYTINPFNNYESVKEKFDVTNNVLVNGSLTIKYELAPTTNGLNDYISFSYFEIGSTSSSLKTPSDFSRFYVDASSNARIEKSLADSLFSFYDIQNVESIRKLSSKIAGGKYVVSTGYSTSDRQMCAVKRTTYKSVNAIKPVKGFENDLVNANYLILGHEAFMAETQQYAIYRRSEEGGGYNVHVVDIERVLDQYGYGEKNPLAVKSFLKYLIDNNHKPEFLFIIGDGAAHHNQNGSKPFARQLPFMAKDKNGDLYYGNQDYIFTFGDPGWDMGFSTNIGGATGVVPAIPTGRLAVREKQEVLNYLEKVKEHESNSVEGLWRKRAVHLSGGRIASEQTQFLNYVNQYKTIFESPFQGGKVTTFSKKSSDVVEFFNISKEVNKGVGLITYIGHSSPTYIEIDIGEVSNAVNGYANKGMYPMLLLNGCAAGDIFSSISRAQDWLNAPNKGAIASLAHTSYGYTGELRRYSKLYYEKSFADSLFYNKPIGIVQKEIIENLIKQNGADPIVYTQAQQMFLLGDPALVIFADSLPDYTSTFARVGSFNEEKVTAVSDSFYIDVLVNNYGRVIDGKFSACIERVNSQNQLVESYGPFSFPAVAYQDTIRITLYNSEEQDWGGVNEFTIQLNCDSVVDQKSSNDVYSFRYVMPENGVNNLFPINYAVLSDSIIDFTIQSYDINIAELEYALELDTSIYFNNPIVAQSKRGGTEVIFNNVELSVLKDTTVYYWRTKIAGDTIWEFSTFTFIKGREGVGQFHIDQYYDNLLIGVERKLTNDDWEFVEVSSTIKVGVAGHIAKDYASKTNLIINGQSIVLEAGKGDCANNGIYLMALDPVTTLPYNLDGVDAGNCGQKPRIAMSFPNLYTTANQNVLIDYLNRFKKGDVVLLFTAGNATMGIWPDTLKAIFNDFGATLMDSVNNGYPYVLIGRKGGSSFFEKLMKTNDSEFIVDYEFVGSSSSGVIWTPLIGPAYSWDTFEDKFDLLDSDEVTVDIYGVRSDFTDTLVWSFASDTIHKLSFDTTSISAINYPYLKIKSTVKDSSDLTAPQLKYWNVGYTSVPDGAMAITDSLKALLNGVTLSEGELFSANFDFENISRSDFNDSIQVEFQIIGEEEQIVWYETYAPIKSKDTLSFEFNFNSIGFVGNNLVQVFVNPFIQQEQDYTNNVFEFNINVIPDEEHPILDVTVNNKHIKDGAWVLNNPVINAVLRDNNTVLQASDTSSFFVYFKAVCDSCEYNRIYFSDPRLSYTSDIGVFDVVFLPGDLEVGKYQVKIYAFDIAGNKTSELPYEVSFTVKTDLTLDLYGPYPNPMKSTLKFVFDVSGALPDDIEITIHDLLGRLIRTLTIADFKTLAIGETSGILEWDGTDEFGSSISDGQYVFTISGAENFTWNGVRKGNFIILR